MAAGLYSNPFRDLADRDVIEALGDEQLAGCVENARRTVSRSRTWRSLIPMDLQVWVRLRTS
jgi:hypothetical protein